MPDQEMTPIEKMAAAFWDAHVNRKTGDWKYFAEVMGDEFWEVAEHRKRIRAALRALSDAGYVVVPKKPTARMIDIGWGMTKRDGGYGDAVTLYADMLNAAPEVT